jgi:hypothetical protein
MLPYKQGIYHPFNPQKYKGTTPIIYRSHPEYKLMYFFDHRPNIVEWSSESIVIPYLKPTDGKIHRYFVDFTCVLKDLNGNLIKYLVEYKPLKQTIMPEKGKKTEKTFLTEQLTYGINMSKWKSAREYAHKHNMKFLILTEKDLP